MAYEKGLTGHEYTRMLKADFEHIDNARKIINDVFNKVALHEYNKMGGESRGESLQSWTSRMMTDSVDFGDILRKEIGKVLGIVAARQRAKVPANKSGLERGIGYGVFKNSIGGSVGMHSVGRRRLESVKRHYTPGHQREVSDRTRLLNEYYGRDRAFVLRMLNFGTDIRTVTSGAKGKGSRSTWGSRGAIEPKQFFHSLASDMERAAQEIGMTITGYAEKIVEQAFEQI